MTIKFLIYKNCGKDISFIFNKMCTSKYSSVVLVLVWLMLIRMFDPNFKEDQVTPIYNYIRAAVQLCFFFSLPIAGLYSDIKLGRLNSILITAAVDILANVLIMMDVIFNTTWITSIASPISFYSHRFLIVVGLSLGADQITDASSRQLSCYVWWYSWSLSVGWLVTSIVKCTTEEDHNNRFVYNLSMPVIHLFFVTVIFVTGLLRRKMFNNDTLSKNPLKLISNVLNFARKHKFPIQRSALTYWENRHPSRIDLGKEKYGGPFDENEVEDVKTFFCILPLIVVVTIVYLPNDYGSLVSNDMASITFYQCIITYTYSINYIINILCIPVYTYFNHQRAYCCYKLTMLRKIALGIFLSSISKLGYIFIEVYAIPHTETYLNSTITVNNSTVHQDIYFLYIIPDVVRGFGGLLIIPTGLEFVFAQSPYNMRGILIGVWYACTGIYAGIGIQLSHLILEHWYSSVPIVLLINFSVVFTGLLVFIVLSKRYKLRVREDVFNGYAIVEDHIIEDINRREMYGSLSIN